MELASNCSRNRSDNTSPSDTEPDAILSPKNNENCRATQSPDNSSRIDNDRAPFGIPKINRDGTTHSTEVQIKKCRAFRMLIKQLYRIIQEDPILVANCESRGGRRHSRRLHNIKGSTHPFWRGFFNNPMGVAL